MKGLILKDYYNIRHNAKSMLLILVVLAVSFVPTSGVMGSIFVCAISCSIMIVTTFAFDSSSRWTRYAMITPVSKKDLVAGKFVVLAIFCIAGGLFGLVVGTIGGLVMKTIVLDLAGIGELLFSMLVSWAVSLILGSMSILVVFKFGAEKARLLLLVSYLIPAGICAGGYQLLASNDAALTETLMAALPGCLPVIALLWCFIMYRISCRIFEKKEL